jgi:hypothetical protein
MIANLRYLLSAMKEFPSYYKQYRKQMIGCHESEIIRLSIFLNKLGFVVVTKDQWDCHNKLLVDRQDRIKELEAGNQIKEHIGNRIQLTNSSKYQTTKPWEVK